MNEYENKIIKKNSDQENSLVVGLEKEMEFLAVSGVEDLLQ